MKEQPSDYVNSGKHLPDIMKDFHDQKDLFKSLQDWAGKSPNFKDLPNTWVDNHVFVIDYFLWFMGLHGYKLQKARADVDFYDINQTIEVYNERSTDLLSSIINNKNEQDDNKTNPTGENN